MPERDAILIPGGGVREGGLLPSWARARLDRAIQRHTDEYLITLSAGTTHRPPPLDRGGFPILESMAGARYLFERGVPAERILTESFSLDTIGNAFFSRVIHAEPRDLHRLLVITSDFHLERTRAVFEWVYGLTPISRHYELSFEGVSDPEIHPDVLSARREKERDRLSSLAEMKARISTLVDFHRWLFTEHAAYRPTDWQLRRSSTSTDLIDSY